MKYWKVFTHVRKVFALFNKFLAYIFKNSSTLPTKTSTIFLHSPGPWKKLNFPKSAESRINKGISWFYS